MQLSDSPLVDEPEADYLTAALTRQQSPGEGALDLVGLVRLLDFRGCLAPIGVEVCSERLATEPPETVARRAQAGVESPGIACGNCAGGDRRSRVGR